MLIVIENYHKEAVFFFCKVFLFLAFMYKLLSFCQRRSRLLCYLEKFISIDTIFLEVFSLEGHVLKFGRTGFPGAILDALLL